MKPKSKKGHEPGAPNFLLYCVVDQVHPNPCPGTGNFGEPRQKGTDFSFNNPFTGGVSPSYRPIRFPLPAGIVWFPKGTG